MLTRPNVRSEIMSTTLSKRVWPATSRPVTPNRAASRKALSASVVTNITIPNSMAATAMRNRIGAAKANSTAAEPASSPGAVHEPGKRRPRNTAPSARADDAPHITKNDITISLL